MLIHLFYLILMQLLSSEDLWMYAPLAYKGMDIGLDLKISAQIWLELRRNGADK